MSYHPTYLVFFPGSRDVTLAQAQQALSKGSAQASIVERQLRDHRQTLIEVRDTGFDVDEDEEDDGDGDGDAEPVVTRVYHRSDADVAADARRIAASAGADRPDRDAIAACDRCFEVVADADEDGDYFNNWLIAAERLQALVGGVLYDPEGDSFVGDATLA